MKSVESAKLRIREIIAGSQVPEDLTHAENTLQWLLRLDSQADSALQLAAFAHDIDRAIETRKVRRSDYSDYDAFKAAHAANGATILREILEECQVVSSLADEVCLLVARHEFGGDGRADLLKEADSLSFFEVNLPFYYQREGWEETQRRCAWGYSRLSERNKKKVKWIHVNRYTKNRLGCSGELALKGRGVIELKNQKSPAR